MRGWVRRQGCGRGGGSGGYGRRGEGVGEEVLGEGVVVSPGGLVGEVGEDASCAVGLRIVHASVWERFEGATPAEDLLDGRSAAAALQEIITSAESRARRRRPEVSGHGEVLPGEPIDVLVHAGESAFALVVGHRGHSALMRHLSIGSIGPGLAERAWCPVVEMRQLPQ
ncbi:universal stress protein [Streptomyces sp. NPDC048232]|uniref:universal stress protein n=1 Tax=Streptomyces sp. NPDC048232 TaxID=3365520 RepID=UPI00371C62C2